MSIVKVGDKIDFRNIGSNPTFNYIVRQYGGRYHLENIASPIANNDAIFKALGITDICAFCKEAYGYSPRDGVFPETCENDSDAIDRVICALNKECRKVGGDIRINDTSWIEESSTTSEKQPSEVPMTEDEKAVFNKIKSITIDIFYQCVKFTVNGHTYSYFFVDNHLYCEKGDNDAIFEALQIPDKYAFCTKYYGYSDRDGQWPPCRCEDYDALRRVIAALTVLCANKGGYVTINGIPLIAVKEASVSEDVSKLVINGPRESLKVGDRVKILPRQGKSIDYPGCYVDDMTEWEGEIFTITNVTENRFERASGKKFDVSFDRSSYLLSGTSGYAWCRAELELVESAESVSTTKPVSKMESVCTLFKPKNKFILEEKEISLSRPKNSMEKYKLF